MAERTLRGARLGGQSFEDERGIEFAARQQVGYRCTHGHEFEITMSIEADIPANWECPRCGAEGLSTAGIKPIVTDAVHSDHPLLEALAGPALPPRRITHTQSQPLAAREAIGIRRASPRVLRCGIQRQGRVHVQVAKVGFSKRIPLRAGSPMLRVPRRQRRARRSALRVDAARAEHHQAKRRDVSVHHESQKARVRCSNQKTATAPKL